MKSLKRNKLIIVGAIYDMHTGKVEFISKTDAKGHHLVQAPSLPK